MLQSSPRGFLSPLPPGFWFLALFGLTAPGGRKGCCGSYLREKGWTVHHPLPLQQRLSAGGAVAQVQFLRIPYSQPEVWGRAGECHGWRLSPPVFLQISCNNCAHWAWGLLCFKSCSGPVVARIGNQSVPPNRLEKTHLFIVYVTNKVALALGHLHFQGEQFIFNYFISCTCPLQT